MIEETKFIDENAQNSQEDSFSFRVICMGHIRKILNLASVEFRGGYWQSKIHNNGNVALTEKIYIPDTREEYINSIDCLFDLLYPHLTKEYLDDFKEIFKEIETARKECLTKTILNESEVLSSEFYNGKDKITIENFKILNVKRHRELFRILSLFIKQKNYFTSTGIEE